MNLLCCHGHPNPLLQHFWLIGVSLMWYKTQTAALRVMPGGATGLFNPLEVGAQQEWLMEKANGLFAALAWLAAVLLLAKGGLELLLSAGLSSSLLLSPPRLVQR